jgi:MerR family transcriptional regulator/heat shock protein HspR
MHPQTLRKYERAGFLTPDRTGGMLRLCSEEDISRLQLIKHLVDDLGLNLSGVQLALQLASVVREAERTLNSDLPDGDQLQRLRLLTNAALQVLGTEPFATRDGPSHGTAPPDAGQRTDEARHYR